MQKVLIYLMLTVAPLVFFTDLTRNPYYFQIVFLNAATVLFWMIFLWRSLGEKKIVLKTSVPDLPLLAFFAFATFTWLFNLAANFSDPFLKYSCYAEGSKRWLFTLVNVVLVYYIPLNFSDEEFAKSSRSVIFFVAFAAAVYGIMQFLGLEVIWPNALNPFGGRSVSTFGNPNFLSSFLVVLLPIVLAEYINARGAFSVAVYFAYIFFYAVSLIVTLTRSSWAGAACALAVFFAVAGKKIVLASKKRLVTVAAALALALVLWPHPKSSTQYVPAVYERIAEIGGAARGTYGPLHQRFLIWSCAWQMTKDNPVVGRGWGLFELFYPYYQGKYLFLSAYRNLRTHANNTHNEILEIISQTGIVGFGIYVWFIVVLLKTGFAVSKSQDGPRRIVSVAMLAGIVGMLVDNLMNVTLHFAVPAFLYWWMIGQLLASSPTRKTEISLDKPAAKILVAALLLAGAAAVVKYYKNFMGEINYFAGFKLSKRADVSGALPYLERAHKYQRFEVNNNYELGNVYARLGRRDDAVRAYEEALRANAGYDEIFFNMATVYNQSGDIPRAIAGYSRSLAINPLSHESYAALGSLYFANLTDENIRAARALFRQAREFFPGNKDISNNLGYISMRLGDTTSAASYYREALTLDPDFSIARRNLENLSQTSGVKIGADDFEKRLGRIESLISAGKTGAALALAVETANMHKDNFRAKFYLANVQFVVGNLAEAERLYTELIRAQPGNTAVRANMAFVYEKQERPSAAAEQWREILRRDPSNAQAAARLERLK